MNGEVLRGAGYAAINVARNSIMAKQERRNFKDIAKMLHGERKINKINNNVKSNTSNF